jgi:hypothetical protein
MINAVFWVLQVCFLGLMRAREKPHFNQMDKACQQLALQERFYKELTQIQHQPFNHVLKTTKSMTPKE